MPLKRIALILASAAAAAGACAAEEKSEDAELKRALQALPKWSISASVDASYGYRDNLLLSAMAEERSPFARGVAELMLLKVPTGRFEYSFFIQGERTHFFDGQAIDHEAQAWAQTEFGYRLGDSWRIGLPLIGYYTDRVFDLSDEFSNIETERDVTELTVHGAMVSPVVRWNIHSSWWIEAQASGERKRYRDGGNDGTVGEGVVRLGWLRSERLEARLIGTQRWRNFDRRARYSAVGREIPRFDTNGEEIPGRALKISERELESRLDIGWDKANRWRTITRAGLLHYRDNGSGYFNYRELRLSHEIEWTGERWLVRMEGSARRQNFAVQTVDSEVGESSRQPRIKDEYSAELHVERKLSLRWTALGNYRWERSRSNDLLASYRVNEGLLGLRWSWDK